MSKEFGEGNIDLMHETESIRDGISRWTGADYSVISPPPPYPNPSDSVGWFILGRKLSQAKLTAYAKALWKDAAGAIWVESTQLGDTIGWVELNEGEEAAIEAFKIDQTEFFKPEFRIDFGKRFPIVYEYLLGYEAILADVSARRKVQLQMRYVGHMGNAVFFMNAKIEAANHDLRWKLRNIRLNVLALKLAMNSIKRFEIEMARKLS